MKSRRAKQQKIVEDVTNETRAAADMQQLYRLESDAEEAESVMLERQESYKDSKASYEASQTRIRDFIRACRDEKQDFPLLNQEATSSADESPDGWRATPIDQVLQDAKIVTALKAESVTTLGSYVDWRAAKAGDGGHYEPLLTIKGIGQARADKAADQVIAWWAKAQVEHPRWGQDEKPATGKETDGHAAT